MVVSWQVAGGGGWAALGPSAWGGEGVKDGLELPRGLPGKGPWVISQEDCAE